MQSEIVVIPIEQIRTELTEAVRNALGTNARGVGREAQELDILSRKETLTDQQVQRLYGINRGTLRNWRCMGRGPAFVKDGKIVLYRRKDIEAYLQSHRVKTYEQG